MKKLFRGAVIAIALLLALSLVSCAKEEEVEFELEGVRYITTQEKTDYVLIEMADGGRIIIQLDAAQAPVTVQNFQKLVAEDFYDGLKFHRVSKNFVIQAGCPEGTGMGGPGYTIKGEFSANGVDNTLSHERGVISMARSAQGYNTAGSQFFICLSTPICKQLNGQYAAFGRVIAGMDTVDAIAGVTVAGETPLKDQVMKKVTFVQPISRAETTETQEEAPLPSDPNAYVKTEEESNLVCIEMTTGEKMILSLDPESAPLTVQNFQKLVSQDFYDGLTFHRLVSGAVLQGGCPEGTGRGGPGWTITGEFTANGVQNLLSHTKGVVSMARSANYNSAGSQFFFCLSDACTQYDGSYAAFGRVVAGLETLEALGNTPVEGDTPKTELKMKEVYFVTVSAEPPSTGETQAPATTPATGESQAPATGENQTPAA